MRRDFLKDLGLSEEIIDKIMAQYGLDNDQVVLLKFDKGQKFFLLGVQRF